MSKEETPTAFMPEPLDLFGEQDCFIIRERDGHCIARIDNSAGWVYASARRFPTLERAYTAANKMGFTRAFRIGRAASLALYTGRSAQ